MNTEAGKTPNSAVRLKPFGKGEGFLEAERRNHGGHREVA